MIIASGFSLLAFSAAINASSASTARVSLRRPSLRPTVYSVIIRSSLSAQLSCCDITPNYCRESPGDTISFSGKGEPVTFLSEESSRCAIDTTAMRQVFGM